jgi:hypothetical protein
MHFEKFENRIANYYSHRDRSFVCLLVKKGTNAHLFRRILVNQREGMYNCF